VSMGIPWCFYPADYGYGLSTMSPTSSGLSGTLKRTTTKSSYVMFCSFPLFDSLFQGW
jgi:hypothetical protein